MPVPTAVTEPDLVGYMLRQLGTVADVLGWDAQTFTITSDAVIDTLIVLEVSVIASATNIPKLRAAARLAIWRLAVPALAGLHDFSTDGQSMSLSQVQAAALRALDQAERDAAVFGLDGSYIATRHRVDALHDPYSALDAEDRVL